MFSGLKLITHNAPLKIPISNYSFYESGYYELQEHFLQCT